MVADVCRRMGKVDPRWGGVVDKGRGERGFGEGGLRAEVWAGSGASALDVRGGESAGQACRFVLVSPRGATGGVIDRARHNHVHVI